MLCSNYSEPRASLSDFFRSNFSETLEREVVAPALSKFLPGDLADLEWDAYRPFLHPRFIALDHLSTTRLKTVPAYDRIFAWHRPAGHPALYYPQAGGIGAYTDELAARLQSLGVILTTGATLSNLEASDGQVTAATLSNGHRSECDLLVWTLPSPPLSHLLGLVTAQTRPTLLTTTLLHLEISEPFETGLHYFYCYDPDRYLPPDVRLFRVTLYPNFRQDGRNLCTLELFGDGAKHPDLAPLALQEQKGLGVASTGSEPLFVHGPMVFSGFPLWNRQLASEIHRDLDQLQSTFRNVRLLAKARGRAFLMHEIIAECAAILHDD
jgi:protoporphyrinogen oxidase